MLCYGDVNGAGFLIDQLQQLCCKVFQKARQTSGAFKVLYEKIRVLIRYGVWGSFQQLLSFIGNPQSRPPPGQHRWVHA